MTDKDRPQSFTEMIRKYKNMFTQDGKYYYLGHSKGSKEEEDNRKYMSPEKVAQLLSLPEEKIKKLIDGDEIPYTQLGDEIVVPIKELDDYLNKNTLRPIESKVFNDETKKYESIQTFDKKYLKQKKTSKPEEKWYIYKQGHVFNRKLMSGQTRWYIQFRDTDKRWKQRPVRNGSTRMDAIQALQKEYRRVYEEIHGLRLQTSDIKFKEFSKMYINDYAKQNKKSWRTDECFIKQLNKFFGNMKVKDITARHVEQYKSQRAKKIKKNSVNQELAILRKMMNVAQEWEYRKKPIKVKLFSRAYQKRDRVLSNGEEKKLLESADSKVKPAIILALNTGMRMSEILNLRWRDIDFENREIVLKKTKSWRPRNIPMNQTVYELFNSIERKGDRVFNFNYLSHRFSRLVKKLGITNLTFHDLRHTFESRLLSSGIDISSVRDLMGHSSFSMTSLYAHSQKELRQKAVLELENS